MKNISIIKKFLRIIRKTTVYYGVRFRKSFRMKLFSNIRVNITIFSKTFKFSQALGGGGASPQETPSATEYWIISWCHRG